MSSPTQLPTRFEAVEAIASTPLERTFRAFDRVLQREVVVRLPAIAAWSGWSAPVRERLLREARALAKVQHESVVSILWVEETPDGPLLVQPPHEGERLGERLQHGALPVDAVVALGIRIGEALAAVHYCGIVHRGVGPDAIWLLADGRARLGAFTFAKAFDARLPSSIDHGRRQDPAVAAVLPTYPAPEQLAGRGADPRVDVWALGCLLFRCLVGVDPAPAGDGSPSPDVRSLRKDVPKALAEVLRTCMQTAPTARFPTAQAVVDALKALQEPRTTGPGSRRALVLGGVAVVALGALALWRPWSDANAGWSPEPLAAGPARLAATDYSDRYAKGHALLIGIADAYDGVIHKKLNGPVNEIEAVRQRLLANDPLWGGDAITVLANKEATRPAIRDALRTIRMTAGPDDAVFIYFAGHGQPPSAAERSGRFWLVCSEAKKEKPGDSEEGFLDKEELLDFKMCEVKHVLVVVDCCYGGKLFDVEPVRGRPIEEPASDRDSWRASPHLRHRARDFLASAGPDTVAKDAGPAGISKFCTHFLAALTPKGPHHRCVTFDAIWAHIDAEMPDEQKPMRKNLGDPHGRFVFFLPPPK